MGIKKNFFCKSVVLKGRFVSQCTVSYLTHREEILIYGKVAQVWVLCVLTKLAHPEIFAVLSYMYSYHLTITLIP